MKAEIDRMEGGEEESGEEEDGLFNRIYIREEQERLSSIYAMILERKQQVK